MDHDRPNILVVLTDDHAQWAMGAYGNREVRSPSMDWLADQGVRMANAFTPTPVCSPARGCFWTGRAASQHGIHDYLAGGAFRDGTWLDGEVILPELLRDAGYTCGFFGKWHCGRPEETWRGFDAWCCIGRRTGPHHGDQPYIHDGRAVTRCGYQTQLTADAARAWLGQRDRDRPFFAFVGPVATHSPWNHHPPRLVRQYADCTFDELPDDVLHPFGRFAGEGVRLGRDDWHAARMQYYAAVSEIDEQLGRLLDDLDQQGELDRTLVVYTADHGLNCGHHGLWGKGNATRPLNMVEESIRIPMLFGGWSALAGRRAPSAFVDHCDLFATLCDIAGADRPTDRHYPGRSFAPMLFGRAIDDWRSVQVGEYGDLRMARSARTKLIRRHGRGDDQLFDLIDDPRETRNVIGDPAQAQTVRELDAAIEAYFAPMADSPFSGLRVADLRPHNEVEAWRGQPG